MLIDWAKFRYHPASRTQNFTFRTTLQQAPPGRLNKTSSDFGVVHRQLRI
jgi:hypothetical protein